MKFLAALLLSCLVAASTGAPHLPVYSGVSHAHNHVPVGYNHHGYNSGYIKPGHLYTGYKNQYNGYNNQYSGSKNQYNGYNTQYNGYKWRSPTNKFLQ